MEKGGLLRRAARPTSRAASYLRHFLLPRVIPGRTAAKQKFSWWYRQAILLVQPQSIIKQINLRLTNEEFLRKHESEFRSAIPDCGKFSQLKIFHLLKQHVASGWCQGLPSVACTHNLLSWLFWQYSSKSRARTTVNIKPSQAWNVIFSLGSVEESFQHPPCPHILGYTAPAVGQGTWGRFSLELTLQEGCLLLQRGARDKRSRSCHRLRRKSPRAGAPRQPGGRGLFLSGRFSQFSQVPDASDVTDIWIQFLQRKNLRHFNPFGGSKSGPKRKSIHYSRSLFVFIVARLCSEILLTRN